MLTTENALLCSLCGAKSESFETTKELYNSLITNGEWCWITQLTESGQTYKPPIHICPKCMSETTDKLNRKNENKENPEC